jgi:hypothetical protein
MTEAERIVAWAERHTGEAPVSKRPQGRAGHLSENERHAIRLAYLEAGGHVTQKELAVQFNVHRDTVAACLQGPAYEALQRQLEQARRDIAFQRLKANVLPAADAWCDAVAVAAEKGDHKPARDLLLHTNVIEPVQKHDNEGITIHIGCGAGDVKIGVMSSPPPQLTDAEWLSRPEDSKIRRI